ncbi:MAG: orotidine-5'-phosphate decarboxylase [Desulfovibrio sp.]|nr:orotidine-5'-phosphate decarboxylase [Desulfovibrio sp.]
MAELILALDLPDKDKALRLLDELDGALVWCKVGMEMFTHYGPPLLAELASRKLKIFLDLKFYDIPHTVAQAVLQASLLGVDLLTVHCQGGQRMLEDCVAAREKAPKKIMLFGVTVLTSFASGEMPGISIQPKDFATSLAALANDCGLDGVVCSPQEVAQIKHEHPHLACLCPGVRPTWAGLGDQRRVATPGQAVSWGADYLVVGRPILQAKDHRDAFLRICEEMSRPL